MFDIRAAARGVINSLTQLKQNEGMRLKTRNIFVTFELKKLMFSNNHPAYESIFVFKNKLGVRCRKKYRRINFQ
jgi:hypothetical protein